MSRELNPNLFNQNTVHLEPTPQFKSDKYIDRQEVKKVEERFSVIQDRMNENLKTLNLKTERMLQRVSQLEQKVDAGTQDSRAKYASLSGKLTERGLVESELQAMLDRHNQIVRNFEARMSQMQKLVEYQQLQIMNSSATLEEVRREFARMKK